MGKQLVQFASLINGPRHFHPNSHSIKLHNYVCVVKPGAIRISFFRERILAENICSYFQSFNINNLPDEGEVIVWIYISHHVSRLMFTLALTRQHCRLSICEYWLSWTNTEQKIPITILILKRGPCLIRRSLQT